MWLEGYIRWYQNWIQVLHRENIEDLANDVITLLA